MTLYTILCRNAQYLKTLGSIMSYKGCKCLYCVIFLFYCFYAFHDLKFLLFCLQNDCKLESSYTKRLSTPYCAGNKKGMRNKKLRNINNERYFLLSVISKEKVIFWFLTNN